MSYDVVSSYDCDASQVACARSWVHDELAERLTPRAAPDLVDDATLIVSELLTNAIRAGCDAVTVGLTFEAGCVRVGVSDDAPGVPAVRAARRNEDTGRGLPIVAALAQDWGVVRPADDRRKEVWATLALQ